MDNECSEKTEEAIVHSPDSPGEVQTSDVIETAVRLSPPKMSKSRRSFREPVSLSAGIEGKEDSSEDDVFKQTPHKLCKEAEIKSTTGRKPRVICKFCHASFSKKSGCTRHESICDMNGEKSLPTFPCPHCGRLFHRKYNVSRHSEKCKAKCPKNNLDSVRNRPTFQCAHCKTVFGRKSILRCHLKKCTSENPLQQKSKTPCLVKNCDARFLHKTALINHLSSTHQNLVTIKPREMKTFSSIEEFSAWKEQEEENTFSYYTARKGITSNATQHFYCQHDGSSKLHAERKTSRRRHLQSIKVGHYCISKIKMTVTDTKTVNVEYYPTHSHLCKQVDQRHQPIPAAMSKFIDEKLAEKIPPAVVYDLAKEYFLPQNNTEAFKSRAANLTRGLVLKRGWRRRAALRLDEDDAASVYLLAVQHIEEDDSVLIYKPLGSEVVRGPQEINDLPKSEDLFMFAFQTDYQLKLMKTHCSKILIIDETNNTNQYKYQLLTVMVVDEHHRGWPVAHLISSRSDADTLQFFFQTLRLRLQCEASIINTVITDDDAALINAMEAGFCQRLTHLLCKWQVIKNLKEQMRIKVSNNLINEMMSEVKDIINVKEESLFLKLKNGFQKKYESNPEAAKYLSYLDQHYWNRAGKWAMCYRNFPYANVDTTGLLKSFHNRLKSNCLKRVLNKRCDDLINILYDIAWNDECTRSGEAETGLLAQPQQIFERHQKGLLLKDDVIIEQALDSKLWQVKSRSGSGSDFIVRNMEYCELDLCYTKCSKVECHGLCSHIFSCSCPDHHPLCKHIHKLQSVLFRNAPPPPVPVEEGFADIEISQCVSIEEDFYNIEHEQSSEACEELNENNNETAEEPSTLSKRERKILLEKLQSHLASFQEFMAQDPDNISDHCLILTETVLSSLASSWKPEEPEAPASQMEPTVKFAPFKKRKL